MISVVVATHRRPESCERLLRSLTTQTIPSECFEVVVVDDCSGDRTGEMLHGLAADLPYQLTTLRTPANRGPGPARNLGWQAARARYVAFTDDDCLPAAGWLAAGMRALESDPALGVVQGRTVPTDPELVANSRWHHAVHVPEPTPYFETCNIFYRKEALENTAGFGETYNWWGGWYCEDTLAGWRVVDGGWSRGFASDALVSTEVDYRGLSWWLKKSLVLYVEIGVARAHSGFRREAFWQSWSPRRHDAAFAIGCIGVAAALRWRPAAALALPYIWWRHPSRRSPRFLQECLETVVVDAARSAGILYGALRYRTLVI